MKRQVLFYAAAAAMLLTAFFWMPLLEFYFTNDLCIHHALHTTDIFAGSITSLFIPSFQADKLFFGLTIFIPAFYILYKYNKSRTSIYLFCVGTLLAVITTDIFPFWKNTAFSVIQFPWRLYGIATLCISLSFAFLSEKFFSAKQYDKICYSIGIIILSANIIVLYACIVRPQYYHAVSKTEFGGANSFFPACSNWKWMWVYFTGFSACFQEITTNIFNMIHTCSFRSTFNPIHTVKFIWA